MEKGAIAVQHLYKNDLVIAYIKELLKDFNLPMVPVLTDATKPYKGRLYVKDRKIGYFGEEKFEPLYDFVRNYKMVNLTKNFIIKSSIYDEYTHNYLGEYLRFLRDYDGINLMGMYNCFYKQQPRKLERREVIDSEGNIFDINTDNTNFNYYLIPVKFNQLYTISISSGSSYEMALVIHNNINLSESGNRLIKATYQKVRNTSAKAPFLFNTEAIDDNGDIGEELWDKEKYLRLLIKIPAAVKSSITILEGDWTISSNYLTTMSSIDATFGDREEFFDSEGHRINIIPANQYFSKSSLIRTDDKTQVPFADRLVEYLLANAITSNDFIDSNIKRLQDQIYLYTPEMYGVWTTNLRNKLYSLIFDEDLMLGNSSKLGTNVYLTDTSEGLIKISEVRRLLDARFDLTGFVDKDLERQLELTREREI